MAILMNSLTPEESFRKEQLDRLKQRKERILQMERELGSQNLYQLERTYTDWISRAESGDLTLTTATQLFEAHESEVIERRDWKVIDSWEA